MRDDNFDLEKLAREIGQTDPVADRWNGRPGGEGERARFTWQGDLLLILLGLMMLGAGFVAFFR